jgi:hypothetical protein
MMTTPSLDQALPYLVMTEPTDFADMAAIVDLYPSKPVEEKRATRELSLRPEFAASLDRRRTVLLVKSGGVLVGTVQVVWEDPAEEPALLPPGSAVIHHL